MGYGSPHGSFWKRFVLKCLRIALVLAAYCWAGQAIYLWASSGFYPDYGTWARVYLAIRDGLHDLPDTMLFVLEFAGQLISIGHNVLVAQLGYDPVVVPQIGGAPSFPVSSSAAGANFVSQAIHGAIRAAIALSVVQFATLFVISAAGVVVGWRYPAVPKILSPVAGVLYLIVACATGVWFIYTSLVASVVSGIMAFTVVVVLLWRPLIAGFPLWLLFVTGFRPRVLMLIPVMLLSLFAQNGQRGPSASDQTKTKSTRNTGGERDHTRTDENADHDVLAHGNLEELLGRACRTLGIPLEEFKSPEFPRRTLTSRFRELAKKLHPDASGSERLMKILNTDFDYLLSYKGWKR